jgi:hypothetical protein
VQPRWLTLPQGPLGYLLRGPPICCRMLTRSLLLVLVLRYLNFVWTIAERVFFGQIRVAQKQNFENYLNSKISITVRVLGAVVSLLVIPLPTRVPLLIWCPFCTLHCSSRPSPVYSPFFFSLDL